MSFIVNVANHFSLPFMYEWKILLPFVRQADASDSPPFKQRELWIWGSSGCCSHNVRLWPSQLKLGGHYVSCRWGTTHWRMWAQTWSWSHFFCPVEPTSRWWQTESYRNVWPLLGQSGLWVLGWWLGFLGAALWRACKPCGLGQVI